MEKKQTLAEAVAGPNTGSLKTSEVRWGGFERSVSLFRCGPDEKVSLVFWVESYYPRRGEKWTKLLALYKARLKEKEKRGAL